MVKKRIISLLLIGTICFTSLLGCTKSIGSSGSGGGSGSGSESGDGSGADVSDSKKPIQITAYSQLANSSGKLTGWFAQVLLEKFNCEMTIIPESDGTFDTRMESGDLGDIILFGNQGSNEFYRALTGGYLYDWYEDDLLNNYGSNIQNNMKDALDANKRLTGQIYEQYEIDKEPSVFGFASNVATSNKDHKQFMYTWDIRWDLYTQLGSPEIKDLNDYYELLVAMKEICPTDENGNPTYAFTMWPDWDGHMMMYAKCFVTTYWGLEGDFGAGLFDTVSGKYYRPIDEESHYFDALRFFNKLYRAGLVDPNSMTQTVQMASEKMLNGGAFASVFKYAGADVYNTPEHQAENKMLLSLVPEEAIPIVYGMSTEGSGSVFTIGAYTQEPELCMSILNWLASPEGFMTYWYGPEAVYDEATDSYDPEGCWYIKDGYAYLTELGESALKSRKKTQMPERWGGGTFQDGVCEINANTWDRDSSNPLTESETYNADYWFSRQDNAVSEVEQSWRDASQSRNSNEYFSKRNKHIINYSTGAFPYTKVEDDLKVVIAQLDDCVKNYSWSAIYAATEEECEEILQEMVKKYNSYDPDNTVYNWYVAEAVKAHEVEERGRGNN